MSSDITDFSARLQELLDETEASYIELIGALELAKTRLTAEALDEDEYDDEEEYEEEDEDDYDE
ncbi:MAG: hypothetical protein AAF648_09740 [Pseudomonadota bacterium]